MLFSFGSLVFYLYIPEFGAFVTSFENIIYKMRRKVNKYRESNREKKNKIYLYDSKKQ